MKVNRIVLKGSEARNKLAKGAKFLSDSLRLTLGPYGQNFFLDKGNKVTNDGVKIANEIVLKDEVENRGVIALREAARKTNDQVGDGTTTAVILAQEIYDVISRKLSDDEKGKLGGVPPVSLVAQIEKERVEVTEKLVAMREEITSLETLTHSAIVAVEDEDLGHLIAQAQWDLGKDGIVIAEETIAHSCGVERVNGIRIDNGLGMTNVINNLEKQSLELSGVHVVLTSHTIKNLVPLEKVIKQLIKAGTRGIVIVARAFTSDAIQDCSKNTNDPNLVNLYPINAPYVDQAEIMRDLQAILGGKYIHNEDMPLEDIQVSDVGFIKKISAERYNAVFIGEDSPEAKERISARVKDLTEKLKGDVSDFIKRNLQQRMAQLRDGFALLKVGSISELERKRLFDKCEDATQAVRAAFQEGVVPVNQKNTTI